MTNQHARSYDVVHHRYRSRHQESIIFRLQNLKNVFKYEMEHIHMSAGNVT